MAFQIRRAHRFLPAPQDQIDLRTSNRENREKFPGSFPVLQILSLTVVLATGFIVPGCAWVTHKPVKYHLYPFDGNATADREKVKDKNTKEDDETDGVRYYLSSPYLLVYTDGKGNLVWNIKYLPDQTKLMVATPHQFFAKTIVKLGLTNGVLKKSTTDSDSTASLKAVIAAVEKVLPLLAPLFTELKDSGTREIPAPRLYKIVVDKDKLHLIGVQSEETVNVTLKPGT